MSTRYVTNAAAALLGGTLVVLSMGLSSANGVRWSAFGIAIALFALATLAQLSAQRGSIQRLLDAGLAMVSGTLIGVTFFYGGTRLTWMVFALALAGVMVAFSGLTVHEVETWRQSHELGDIHRLHLRPHLHHVGAGTATGRVA